MMAGVLVLVFGALCAFVFALLGAPDMGLDIADMALGACLALWVQAVVARWRSA